MEHKKLSSSSTTRTAGTIRAILVPVHRSYGYSFDETNLNWSEGIQYNGAFLAATINYLNERYRAQGFMFLNDVLNSLGFDILPAGQVSGWHVEDDDRLGIEIETVELEDKPGTFRFWLTIKPGGIIVNRI